MNRTELLNHLIRQRNATRYLEIGVHDEQHNFAHVRCAHKVGVDVRPVTTFAGTSDEFFASNREEFDVVFIDAMHTEAQVSQDIANAYGCLARGGAIVLHDCMPPDAWHQRGPEEFREGEAWNGTVWKAVLREFNRTRHRCVVVDTDWGCGVIDTARTQEPVCRELPEELEYERHYAWLLEYRSSVAAFLRADVQPFYHLACMGHWQDVFTEQMELLGRNGFHRIALTVLGSQDDLRTAEAVCAGAGIGADIIVHDADLDRYETPAMLAIEEYARRHEGYVLYLHSKGVSNPADETKTAWRRLLMRELVENWEHCVAQLPYYDAIGVNWRDMTPISHFSGNFWYASTSFLRTLTDFKTYYENPVDPLATGANRLSCEFWIGSAPEPPRVLSLACRNVDFCNPAYWRERELSATG